MPLTPIHVNGRDWLISSWRQHHKNYPPYGAMGRTKTGPNSWYITNAEGNTPQEAVNKLIRKIGIWTLKNSAAT